MVIMMMIMMMTMTMAWKITPGPIRQTKNELVISESYNCCVFTLERAMQNEADLLGK